MENLSSEENLSPMQSPAIQSLPPSGYDPGRIPSMIFSAKPSSPAEWSVTSNESLFSIHMGNNSFSRDYAILFGKSGDVQDLSGSEFPRLDEWTSNNNSNAFPKSGEYIGLPTLMESPPESPSYEEESVKVETQEKEGKSGKDETQDKEVEVDVRITMPAETTSSGPLLEKREMEKPVVVNSPAEAKKSVSNHHPPFQSPPRFSVDSGNSCTSFAFPVLVGEGGKPESLKVVLEQPEGQGQGRDCKEAFPNAHGRTRWCSFLMCWPRCC